MDLKLKKIPDTLKKSFSNPLIRNMIIVGAVTLVLKIILIFEWNERNEGEQKEKAVKLLQQNAFIIWNQTLHYSCDDALFLNASFLSGGETG